MPAQGGEGTSTEWSAVVEFVRAAAEAILVHWRPCQEASVGREACGPPMPEPHPMAELRDVPCRPEGYAFRTRVTDLRGAEHFSVELRTYDPCETLVRVSDVDSPQWQPLAESQASPRRLLPRDQPLWLVTFCRTVPDSFAQRARVQQQIGAQWEEVLLHNLWGEDLSQERLAQLRQSERALHDAAAYWQARCQEQNSLNQQMADLQAQIARLRRQADRESDPAKAMTLRSESRALVKQHDALRQQREQDAGGQALTVCVGVGGLCQADRKAWNTYTQLEPDPPETHGTRRRRSTVVRMPPWRHLFDAGWRLLWLPEQPVQRGRMIDDIMAHLLIYLWQAGMVEREEVAPWLQGYIQSV